MIVLPGAARLKRAIRHRILAPRFYDGLDDPLRILVDAYVVAADVYALRPHTGLGGWTWCTGSAGWIYRLIVESLLGLRLEADKLHFAPCPPADWKEFKLHYRYREAVYHIAVLQRFDAKLGINVTVDGIERGDEAIPLVDDRQEHSVEVRTAVTLSQDRLQVDVKKVGYRTFKSSARSAHPASFPVPRQ